MGLFSRKRRTTVETNTQTSTLTKLVKFTYLQTLALDNGMADVEQFAGVSEESEDSFDSRNVDRNAAERFGEKYGNIGLVLGDITGTVASYLFGKRTRRHTQINVKDSGWSLVKTWNQPQFDIIRYAMGIRELNLSQFTYVPVSEIISKPWQSPKEIVKVSSLVDQFIPSEFPVGPAYIEYYVKPDTDDAPWTRINPIGLPSQFGENGKIIPRIINFNTEQPVNSRLEESYVITEEPVRVVRFRAVLKRPNTVEGSDVSANAYTPILRSYRLMLHPRGGL